MGSGEVPRSVVDAASAPSAATASSSHHSSNTGASSCSAAADGPSTHGSSVGSSQVPSAGPGAGDMLPGLPAALNQRVPQGLDVLGRIGVTPPQAFGTDDGQSLKGLTAVRDSTSSNPKPYA